MTITKTANGTELTFKLAGRLDTLTAPELEKDISESLDGVTKVILDLDELEYISSAGLRVLLSTHKKMTNKGEMIVKNMNDVVTEVLEITGFIDILNIE